MKTIASLLLGALLLAAPAWGQAKIMVSGNQQLAPMVKEIANGLNTGFPTWNFRILNAAEWAIWHKGDARQAICAFSIPAGRITFVDESCLVSGNHDMNYILAHEAGHMKCDCASHAEADKRASTFLMKLQR